VDERHEVLLSSDEDLVQPGEHKFPLFFQLPANLPTSFRGKYGGVSYVLRASFVDKNRSASATGLAPARSSHFFVRFAVFNNWPK